MYKVGITGGIGSGKTMVCKVFQLIGIPVFFADEAAKGLMITDTVLVKQVKKAFGEESYFADGTLNTKWVADIVFANELELERLNALVHPAVFRAFDSWSKDIGNSAPYVLKEAALLFESGASKMCDVTVVVTAPLASRIQRVINRDKVAEVQVMARVEKQFTDEKKLGLAGFHVINDADNSLIEQVLALHMQFLRAAELIN